MEGHMVQVVELLSCLLILGVGFLIARFVIRGMDSKD